MMYPAPAIKMVEKTSKKKSKEVTKNSAERFSDSNELINFPITKKCMKYIVTPMINKFNGRHNLIK